MAKGETSVLKETRFGRHFIRYILRAAVLILGFCFLTQAERIPRVDEMFFHDAGVRWWREGPISFGLWHTPFYLEALRFVQWIFGDALEGGLGSVWKLRTLGLASLCASAALLYYEGRRRMGPESWLPAFLAGLLLVHPLAIQSSLLLDIDNTLQTPMTLLWAVLALRYWEEPSLKIGLLCSLTFAVNMMVKELTPLVLLTTWFGITVLHRPKLAARALAISVLGFGLFLLLLKGWTAWRGFAFLAPLELTFSKSASAHHGPPWTKLPLDHLVFLSWLPWVWLGVPMLIALIWNSTRARSKYGIREPLAALRSVPPEWILGLGVFAAYSYLVQMSFYFPKYTSLTLPLFLLGGLRAHSTRSNSPRNEPRALAYSLLALCALLPLFGLDPLQLTEDRKSGLANALLVHGFALAIPAALVWNWARRYSARSLWIAVIAMSSGLSLAHALRVESPGYNYGERGFEITLSKIHELQNRLGGSPLVLSTAVDLAWALQDQGKLVFFEHQKTPAFLAGAPILVGRTYDHYSPSARAEWREWVSLYFNCHEVVNAPNQRFEWWWKEPEGCAQSNASLAPANST